MSLILGIETSCDETAAAVVRDGSEVVASVLATSSDIHLKTGGVIPEVAARKQVEYIIPVVEGCLLKAGVESAGLSAIAVTVGPGLIGSLIVGVETAKALSLAWGKPLIPVNHLVGHIYGNFINKDPSEIKFPAVVLIVSGGHTDLVLMKGHGNFKYIGGTLDDACGEAFDKSARLLGLAPYMGGPAIAKAALVWEETLKKGEVKTSFTFKRPMIGSKDFNFSFSGIKTAVMAKVKNRHPAIGPAASFWRQPESKNVDSGFRWNDKQGAGFNSDAYEIAYEFQEAITDVLVAKTVKAAKEYNVNSVMLAGGVSANTNLREKFKNALLKTSHKLFVPPIELCTDNAIYIASCAHFNFKPVSYEKVIADPSLTIMSSAALQ